MPPLELVLPKLHPAQQEVWDDQARFKVVCCGRRWGKTHLGVLKCIQVAAGGGHAWWVAPTYPIGLLGWEILMSILRPVPNLEVSLGNKKVVFPSGGWVQIKSAERVHGLRGESLDYVVLDEVADIDPLAWTEALRPALADRRGGAMFIGTPRGQANWMYDYLWEKTYQHGDYDPGITWKGWQHPTASNPYIPQEEIEDARKDMSEIGFLQEFLAEFVAGGGLVFKEAWERYYTFVGPTNGYQGGIPQMLWLVSDGQELERCHLNQCLRFATVDLAVSLKTYADYTVIASWARTPGKRLCLLDVRRDRFEGPDIPKEMLNALNKWSLAYIAVESGGSQLGILQQAQRNGLPVRAIKPDKDKMSRALQASARMEAGQIWFPKGDPIWLDPYRQEIRGFPLSAHDDCVDTLGFAADEMLTVPAGPQIVAW